MAKGQRRSIVDPELDKTPNELLAQTEKEPISPCLRELARRLEAALENVHHRPGGEIR
ncbi:hypothetical protein [Paracoccus sp. (in: a-proteobacteria)]|uniref:hypothetical protein n=1 Tax=Paracoccus sp. TaxID=267 RepID=UPI002AFF64B1|nr:hypothetical protein [Paracoccus sp. (in: a-proteobacteria)]